MAHFRYLLRSITKSFSPNRFKCTNCGHDKSVAIDRKYFVTSLRRCNNCLLQFRVPTDNNAENEVFYNENYEQGFTTSLPSESELKSLIDKNFKVGEKDYSYYISLLKSLNVPAGARIFDFGCSWGYGSYQLRQAGFDVLSYEISRPRGFYGHKHLGVALVDNFDVWSESSEAAGTFDVFFSSHVLEHTPSPSKVIDSAFRLLKPGGIFVAFVPNGTAQARATGKTWSRNWGAVHPNFLDEIFYANKFKSAPRILGSSPLAIPQQMALELHSQKIPATYYTDELRSGELFFAAIKPTHTTGW